MRWNWPPAAVTIPQLESELEQLAAAGIRGVEIGQGGNPTNEQLTAILKKANALGITVGLKYSGGAPITGTWVNTNDYTRKTLNNSRTFVNAGETFNGPCRAPARSSRCWPTGARRPRARPPACARSTVPRRST